MPNKKNYFCFFPSRGGELVQSVTISSYILRQVNAGTVLDCTPLMTVVDRSLF